MQKRITDAYVMRLDDPKEMKEVEHALADKLNSLYNSTRHPEILFKRSDFLSAEKRWSVVRVHLAEKGQKNEKGVPYSKITLGDVLK